MSPAAAHNPALASARRQRLLLVQLRASYQAGQATDRSRHGEGELGATGRIAQISAQIAEIDGLIGR